MRRSIKIKEELYNKLLEIRDKFGVSSISDVIEKLVDMYYKVSTNLEGGQPNVVTVDRGFTTGGQVTVDRDNHTELSRVTTGGQVTSNPDVTFDEGYVEDIIAIADGRITNKRELGSVLKGIVEACRELEIYIIPFEHFEKILRSLYKGGKVPPVHLLDYPDITIDVAKRVVIIQS